MTRFHLDPRLSGDTTPVVELPLSLVLLHHDANYPWTILVPRVPGAVEIADLSAAERAVLTEEIVAVGDAVRSLTGCHKLNVAALGNQVPQLHVHVIGRFRDDPAWPGPVWGAAAPKPRSLETRDALIEALRQRLERTE